MSSEVCPFCGKTYKRLKSHLPHCKAAASSKTPPTIHDVTGNQTSPSSQLLAAFSELTAKSTQTLSVTSSPPSKKKSVVSAAATQSSSLDSASLPPSTKKTKQKLSELIKTAVVPSSVTVSLTSSPSLHPSPSISKPKKQSLRALIEAAKSEQVSKGSLEGTRSTSDDLPSGSAPFVADPPSSRTTAGTRTDPDSVKDDALPAFLSTDAKPKAASKKKASKTKKAAQSLPTTTDTSSSLDCKVHESSARDNFWVEDDGEAVNKMFLKSGSSHRARITLQDVKATLGRANAPRQSGRPSILSQMETTDELSSKISLMSKQASVIPLHQPELTPPAAPLLPGQLSSQVSKASPRLRTVGVNDGLKVTGLLTISPSLAKFSSPLPAARGETMRAGDGLKSQPEVREQNTADKGTTGALTQRCLGQVRLRELPEWLACKTPNRPRDVVEMVQKGWQWYYKRYIDVKKGGAGGLGMLLAGYCVLSYIWSYPHISKCVDYSHVCSMV
ncbi:uncharacterized protein C17orf80 homolog isoform X1 [Anarrhichthys ocellatus]|uniref:uncharacterized protein C17orf80 homolog isoform X1 n=1 Tax=Anarrhichthys ocellatus TaxID=433405 RepID=UPI0012ECBF50|nr:uncharacterized protein C17orf80 homolog isoform X1 [Anarrhichthys ocellatus]